ncbi:hypothetical protein TSOC_001384 [Tetrabaena socialis]|uniref:Uncharacterized protein n=1 Tax=Tetrabaena socialis TaxID=47790 RepID=A0A2J8AGX7_9CHLO|nr:hypothetical protein TSOC_001384 [Tetrabaena socialis]|eukprot:PNH11775.1 hypothetical protein TSOC_001384 [Tetrabaena socialis]
MRCNQTLRARIHLDVAKRVAVTSQTGCCSTYSCRPRAAHSGRTSASAPGHPSCITTCRPTLSTLAPSASGTNTSCSPPAAASAGSALICSARPRPTALSATRSPLDSTSASDEPMYRLSLHSHSPGGPAAGGTG